MQGLHLTADLHGCPIDRAVLTDTSALRALCLAAVGAAGLEAVGELFHRFAPAAGMAAGAPVGITGREVDTPVGITAREVNTPVGITAREVNTPVGITAREVNTPVGITGVVLLAESHLAVHTWPEIAAVTLDVYVCNLGTDNSARAHALMDHLVAAFAPTRVQRHALQRGMPA